MREKEIGNGKESEYLRQGEILPMFFMHQACAPYAMTLATQTRWTALVQCREASEELLCLQRRARRLQPQRATRMKLSDESMIPLKSLLVS